MKLTVDFSALHQAVDHMGAADVYFELDLIVTEIEPIAAMLETGVELGKHIQLDEIDSSFGVLSFKGQQLMLYIPDQGCHIEQVILYGRGCAKGKKVHVAECNTLEMMREAGRFQRYGVISRTNGLFPVFGDDEQTGEELSQEAELNVCKNCLKVLNYQGYSTKSQRGRQAVVQRFDFAIFFGTYSSYFNTLPGDNAAKAATNYTDDWAVVSSQIKADNNDSCQQCGVNLQSVRRLLHVHHINGVKTDNSKHNLRSLCADCHKKQPYHGHLLVKHKDMLTINRLRRAQSKFDVHNYKKLVTHADTALEGLILKCQSAKLPIGELGLSIKCDNEYMPLDLAWPRAKVAVLIRERDQKRVMAAGWNVFSVNDALVKFARFQRHVR